MVSNLWIDVLIIVNSDTRVMPVRFSTDDIAPRDRLAVLREEAGRIYMRFDIEPLKDALAERFQKLIKQDRQRYFFLRRLRYWALSLAAIHARAKKKSYNKLLETRSAFDSWFEEFWKDSFRELVAAYSRAQEDKISNFALARSESRWERIKQQVDLVWGADVS